MCQLFGIMIMMVKNIDIMLIFLYLHKINVLKLNPHIHIKKKNKNIFNKLVVTPDANPHAVSDVAQRVVAELAGRVVRAREAGLSDLRAEFVTVSGPAVLNDGLISGELPNAYCRRRSIRRAVWIPADLSILPYTV